MFKDMSYMTFGNALKIITAFFTTILVAHYARQSDFGIYLYIQTISAVGAAFFTFGLSSAITKEVALGNASSIGVSLGITILYSLMLLALAAVLALVCHGLFAVANHGEEFTLFRLYLPSLIVLQTASNFLAAILQGMRCFLMISLSNLLLSLLNLLLIGIFLKVDLIDANILLLSNTLATIVSNATMLLPILRAAKPQLTGLKQHLLRMFKFSFPLWLNSLQTIIFQRIDTFIVNFYLGPAGVALYEVGRRIPLAFDTIYQSIPSVLFPFFIAKHNEEKYEDITANLTSLLLVLGFVIAILSLVAIAFSGFIMSWLFGEKYIGAAIPFSIIMFSMFFSKGGNILGCVLVACGGQDKPLKINFFMMVVNVALALILIPRFNIIGAAAAVLAANLATFPLNYYFVRRLGINFSLWHYGFFIACPLTVALLIQMVGSSTTVHLILVAMVIIASTMYLNAFFDQRYKDMILLRLRSLFSRMQRRQGQESR